jgi:hypothetical protein
VFSCVLCSSTTSATTSFPNYHNLKTKTTSSVFPAAPWLMHIISLIDYK